MTDVTGLERPYGFELVGEVIVVVDLLAQLAVTMYATSSARPTVMASSISMACR